MVIPSALEEKVKFILCFNTGIAKANTSSMDGDNLPQSIALALADIIND